MATLVAAGVPAGRVNDVAQALADDQTVAREAVVEIRPSEPGHGPPGREPAAAERRAAGARRAPFRGEHTDEVLRELCGYGDARIAELRAAGVAGRPSAATRDVSVDRGAA